MPFASRFFTPVRTLVSLAAILGLALSVWVATRPGGSRTGTGAPGDLPARVVLFAPNLVETACALGYDDRIIAITDYCRWPESILDRPRIGGAIDPDLERLAILDPDLLVLQGESEILRSFANARGIEIADVTMDTDLLSVMAGFLAVDDLLGGEGSGRGEDLVESTQRQLRALAPVVHGESPTVLVVLSREPGSLRQILTAGAGTFLSDLVEVAGGIPWAAGLAPGYFEVPLEVLAADPPDVVVELRAASPAVVESVWTALPGGGPRVEVLDFEGAMIPGPRVVETALRLRDRLWPVDESGDSR